MTVAASQFAALADPSRRAIFERLARRPLSVGALARHFPISRPAVSQHLRVLAGARLVTHRREGTHNIYCINHEGIAAMRDYLDAMWSRALADFKTVAESTYLKSGKDKP